MKKNIVIASLLGVNCAVAATNVGFLNFQGITRGVPIVDNTGVPIASTSLQLSVGTFAPAFVAGIGSLNTSTDDQAVVDAFSVSGTPVTAIPNNLPGLFNTSVSDADNGNSLQGQAVYLMISDTRGATPNVIVVDLGATFPQQDVTGAAGIDGTFLAFSSVIFGDTGAEGLGVPVNTATLEALNAGFGTGFERGIGFDSGVVIPEPSTGLLAAIAGLALAARRRR